MTSTMTVGEVVAAALGRLGVDHAFGVVFTCTGPGAANAAA